MFAAKHIPYNQTTSFSKIVTGYLGGTESLRPFYGQPPTLEGIREKLKERSGKAIDREMLVSVLKQQYEGMNASATVQQNIESLLSSNTFTITTAHQPNLFTGPLYFLYKILHVIKLAASLNEQCPSNRFVPVYYMGSEDADFAELNHTYVDGKKIEWKKEQSGAVGRMVVDKTLVQLIDELEGQLSVEEKGAEVIQLLRKAYINGKTIQAATFELINELYGSYGLVVLIPDHPLLKAQMKDLFADDLFANKPFSIVQKTSERISENYHAQAYPREINLFYLKDSIRERIEKKEDRFFVLNTEISFTEEELKNELNEHPERFSPNVILRGIYQETILPNLVFVGGGGELAYWLQLKDLFETYGVSYPVLVLRNSFLVIEEKWKKKIERLGISTQQLFLPEEELIKVLVKERAEHPVSLNGNFETAVELYGRIKEQATNVDATLSQHVAAIQARSLKALQELEKKMLRAEKRKHTDLQSQVHKIKATLFPNNGLQERVENFSRFYAKWGRSFIEELYNNSLTLEQQFTVLEERG
ncbi:bacillithiol biosynthesis cysteine-adding enzyme BshC [Flavisolibacter ginsenosidimutans]|uniref:Putative cysteine ligase BshC n=1 Tax=Flavisolibacter ginsenosidimutans TaxID=661481 RepID=A0A5B8UDB1_9BACT|nr:bacillithiol biosynthesis cysteine-adding enzyme BshC [Flavisolibacter ginsenosidimutans]QEC54554.1 bacillithiol biosynthesis cysteine-adding enzyme BshC [Flavisolibacter ginsenosidimutans]